MSSIHGCHHCGLLQTLPKNSLDDHYRISCIRCDSLLETVEPDCIQSTLALTITASLLLLCTLIYPFMTLQIEGQSQEATLLTGVFYFYNHDMLLLGTVVALTCIVVPILQLAALLYILLPIFFDTLAPRTPLIFRIFRRFAPWSMIEVFLLGILISVIKLSKLAHMEPQFGLWTFILLITVITAAFSGLNPRDIWRRIPVQSFYLDPRNVMHHVTCSTCHLTQGWPEHASFDHSIQCPRCETKVYYRKPESIQRTMALMIAAFILYIPANLLPITKTVFLGSSHSDTIMSGVLYFISSGSWHIALVIFIASVFVPLVKLIVLCFLLLATQGKVRLGPKECTHLYHYIELVGRWSMVDVFVVTVLVAIVQLEPFAVIKAGVGLLYFAGVVILTMLAAESFDPRLLWKMHDLKDPVSGASS